MKKYLLTIPLAILAGLAVPGIAAAHNASVTPSCSGLSWTVTNYNKEVVNTIVVKVDGATVHQDLDFKASDTGTHPWSQTAAHTWSVVVNAPGTEFDKSFAGTWQPCQTAPSTTVVVVTTTVPASLVPTTTTVVTTVPCQEDDPCWDCTTMGNLQCGTTTTAVDQCCVVVPTTALGVADPVLTPDEPVLPVTGGETVLAVVLAAAFIVAGWLIVRFGAKRRVG